MPIAKPQLFRLAVAALLLWLVSLTAVAAQGGLNWARYDNPRFGYSISLPTAIFEPNEESRNGLKLREIGGSAQLDVHGARNSEQLTPEGYADFISTSDRIREVTYRRISGRWFVLSGHFNPEGDEEEPLIFYTKFLFNSDLSALSAFEISYPRSEKRRFDRIVTRLEKTLTPPD